jgi:hypothetical protein
MGGKTQCQRKSKFKPAAHFVIFFFLGNYGYERPMNLCRLLIFLFVSLLFSTFAHPKVNAVAGCMLFE